MIISGLKPETIMEICGRALSFWVYQIYQEQCYQGIVVKNLEEKKIHSERQLAVCINQAKTELSATREKIHSLLKQQELDKKKHQELGDQCNEKNRQIKKLQVSTITQKI